MTEGEKILEVLSKQNEAAEKRDEKLNKVLLCLYGDETSGLTGIVSKVKRHEKYISTDKKLKWIGAGVMTTGGAGIWEAIQHFLGIHK